VLAGVGDQLEAIIKSVLHVTNHSEVGDGSRHRALILPRPAAALVPPHQGSHLSPPPLTHTLQSHRGDTMYQGYATFVAMLP
jgi:hypothetical protein